MGEIMQFRPKSNHDVVFSERDRVEAMVKGQLKSYTCDSCGQMFDVYINSKPDKCPHCGLHISGWND